MQLVVVDDCANRIFLAGAALIVGEAHDSYESEQNGQAPHGASTGLQSPKPL